MNNIVLIGRLGDDPKLNHTQSGKAVCNFSLATDNNTDKPDWHRIVVWEKQAENAAKYLGKGKKVGIVGRLTYRQYEKDGVKHTQAEIVAMQLEYLTPRDGDGKPTGNTANPPSFPPAGPRAEAQKPQDWSSGSFDDIPF